MKICSVEIEFFAEWKTLINFKFSFSFFRHAISAYSPDATFAAFSLVNNVISIHRIWQLEIEPQMSCVIIITIMGLKFQLKSFHWPTNNKRPLGWCMHFSFKVLHTHIFVAARHWTFKRMHVQQILWVCIEFACNKGESIAVESYPGHTRKEKLNNRTTTSSCTNPRTLS